MPFASDAARSQPNQREIRPLAAVVRKGAYFEYFFGGLSPDVSPREETVNPAYLVSSSRTHYSYCKVPCAAFAAPSACDLHVLNSARRPSIKRNGVRAKDNRVAFTQRPQFGKNDANQSLGTNPRVGVRDAYIPPESHALKACATRRPMHVHSILTTPLSPPRGFSF